IPRERRPAPREGWPAFSIGSVGEASPAAAHGFSASRAFLGMQRRAEGPRSYLRRPAAVGLGVLVARALLVGGCGSGASSGAGEVGVYEEAGARFQDTDATTGALTVIATSSAPAICSGQCVDLAAQATGGVAPYRYAWSPGAAGDGGAAHVCPTATTTYTARATDSSGQGGELARPPAAGSASVTVAVGPSCADGGSPQGTTVLCSRSWAGSGEFFVASNLSVDGWGGNCVATDADHDAYVVLGFSGT